MEINNIDFYNLGYLKAIYTLSDIELNNDVVSVAFLFKSKLLLIELNEEDDTISISVHKVIEFQLRDMKRNKVIEAYFSIKLKYQCIWMWSLINQQGYNDGVQLQFVKMSSDLYHTITIQCLVIASALKFSVSTPIDFD